MDDDDEFTGLFDANLPRADLVSAPANGVDEWLVMKGAQGGGLLDAGFVRNLIAKEDQDVTATRERQVAPNGITLNGSPRAIAEFMARVHKGAMEHSEDGPAEFYAAVVKAKYNADDLRRMASSGAAMADESYPIGDRDDLDKAIRAVGRGGSSHNAIRKHIISRARSLGASSEIPDNWNSDGSLKEAVSKEGSVAAVAKDLMDAAGDAVELDGGMDGLDPTVPLAAPEEEMPGDPTDPGSPAWEAIDAATAQKWLGILARAKNALCMLAEREMVEAASADPDDIEHAWDLEDAQCAIEYAISQLAVFAAEECAEAELGAEMAEIGKALASFDPAPLAVIEGLAVVRKAGRVLSAANEAAIRAAAESLQRVLASLPEAPVAKSTKEGAMPATATAQAPATVAKETATPEAQAADTGPVNAGGTTGLGEPRTTGPAASLPADGPQASLPGDLAGRTVVKGALRVAVYDMGRRLVHVRADRITDPAAHFARVAKADGDGGDGKVTMQAVFDEEGNLVGIVDPADITPVSGAGSKPDAGDGDGTDGEPQPGPAAAAGDMTPQPPADAGTPAEDVAKSGTPAGENTTTITLDVLKSIIGDAVAGQIGALRPAEDVAKSADVAGLSAQVEVLKAQLAVVAEQPAMPRVFTSGQRPPEDHRPLPPQHQMRGQDQGAAPGQVDVAKAQERRRQLYQAPDAAAQNRIAQEMQAEAVDALAAIHRR